MFSFLIFSKPTLGTLAHLHLRAGKNFVVLSTFAMQKNYTPSANIGASNASPRRKTRESVTTDSQNRAAAVSFGSTERRRTMKFWIGFGTIESAATFATDAKRR
jgi:hypothetical protein